MDQSSGGRISRSAWRHCSPRDQHTLRPSAHAHQQIARTRDPGKARPQYGPIRNAPGSSLPTPRSAPVAGERAAPPPCDVLHAETGPLLVEPDRIERPTVPVEHVPVLLMRRMKDRIQKAHETIRTADISRRAAASTVHEDRIFHVRIEGLAMRSGPRKPVDADMLALLREAILTCRMVEFRYRARSTGQTSRQRVESYSLIYGNRAFLVPTSGEVFPAEDRTRRHDLRGGRDPDWPLALRSIRRESRLCLICQPARSDPARVRLTQRNSSILRSIHRNGRRRPSSCRKRPKSNSCPCGRPCLADDLRRRCRPCAARQVVPSHPFSDAPQPLCVLSRRSSTKPSLAQYIPSVMSYNSLAPAPRQSHCRRYLSKPPEHISDHRSSVNRFLSPPSVARCQTMDPAPCSLET